MSISPWLLNSLFAIFLNILELEQWAIGIKNSASEPIVNNEAYKEILVDICPTNVISLICFPHGKLQYRHLIRGEF
jgi:hypothetical protein